MHVSHQLISAEGPDRGSISFIRERGGGRGKEGEKREKGDGKVKSRALV